MWCTAVSTFQKEFDYREENQPFDYLNSQKY
jgi:hypothetical protein